MQQPIVVYKQYEVGRTYGNLRSEIQLHTPALIRGRFAYAHRIRKQIVQRARRNAEIRMREHLFRQGKNFIRAQPRFCGNVNGLKIVHKL